MKIKKTKSELPARHYHFKGNIVSSFPAMMGAGKDSYLMPENTLHAFKISRYDAAQILRDWRKAKA